MIYKVWVLPAKTPCCPSCGARMEEGEADAVD